MSTYLIRQQMLMHIKEARSYRNANNLVKYKYKYKYNNNEDDDLSWCVNIRRYFVIIP